MGEEGEREGRSVSRLEEISKRVLFIAQVRAVEKMRKHGEIARPPCTNDTGSLSTWCPMSELQFIQLAHGRIMLSSASSRASLHATNCECHMASRVSLSDCRVAKRVRSHASAVVRCPDLHRLPVGCPDRAMCSRLRGGTCGKPTRAEFQRRQP